MRLPFLCFLSFLTLSAQEVPLYSGPAPGSESWTWSEEALPSTDGLRRIRNVSRPTLTLYRAAQPNGTAILVCPGGGFRHLAVQHEGEEVAAYLNQLGISAFVLKYRTYRSGDPDAEKPGVQAQRRTAVTPLAVEDGRAAIRMLRTRAKEWGIRPDRIGILGFSAGGYVSAAVALEHDEASRPDFAVPIYPALPPKAKAPARPMPLFLLHADDDPLVSPLENSVQMYTLWKQAKVPAELHIYSTGGHGFGMRKKNLPVDSWPQRLADWLSAQGLLK